jgi:adenylate kinase
MRLILLGPPGCGKGTQAKLLCTRHHLEHIGTGDLLREAIRQNTPLGARAKVDVESGRLVPDELVNDLVAERFHRPDRPTKFVMDGYPRTRAQAQAFDAVLRPLQSCPTAVLLLDVPDEEIIRRLAGRWSCPKAGCKATYHTESNPPKVPGVCDVCGTHLIQRDDDKPETVKRRLVVYHNNTVELIPYYRGQGILHEVSGKGDIEEVYTTIMAQLQPQAGQTC